MNGGASIGDLAFGYGLPAHGAASNVTASAPTPGTIHAEWQYDGADATDAVTALYLDGALASRLVTAATAADLTAPAAASARLDVLSWPRYVAPPALYGGGAQSSRARLTWARVTGAQAYRVYVGGVLTATLDAPALVTGSTLLASGATVTVSGQCAGYTDTTFAVTVTGDTLTADNGTDDVSATVARSMLILGGVWLTFDRLPADGDTFAVTVAIPTTYTTAPLAAGTYVYTVKAVDAAGNESAAAGPVSVVVAPPASPLTNAALAYSDATGNVTLTATAPTGTASVAVYTNAHDLTAAPNLDAPAVTQAVTPGAVTVTVCAASGLSGTLRVIARAVTAGGVDDGTAAPVTIDLPYTTDLPAVQNLTATPTAGGALALAWRSPAVSATPAGWRATVDGGAAVTLTVASGVAAGDWRIGYTSSLTALQCGAAGAHTVVVYAVATSGRAGASGTATATTDATAPSAPATLTAEVV